MTWKVIVITDRRLVPSRDIPGLFAAILAAVPRGSVAIQIREKDLAIEPLVDLARAVVEVARPLGAAVWVNDNVVAAGMVNADGFHLPENGISIETARGLVSVPIGCSRHTAGDCLAAAAAGASLVQFGPIWSVPDKGTPLGPAALTALRRDLPASTRLVAIGGIDSPARAAEAARAGADAVAVMRAAWQSSAAPGLIASIVQSMN